jgi:integrase
VRLRGVKQGQPVGYPCIKGSGPLAWADDATDTTRLLFTTPYGHPVDHKNFYNRVFRPAVATLWPQGHRLYGLRWHDLRHTAASLAIAATGNLGIVQKRLGHENIQTTYNRYHHLLPDADKSLADALAAMYDASEDNVVQLRPSEEA